MTGTPECEAGAQADEFVVLVLDRFEHNVVTFVVREEFNEEPTLLAHCLY